MQKDALAQRDAAAKQLADVLGPAMRRLELALAIHLARIQTSSANTSDDAAEYELDDASRGSVQVLLDAIGRLRAVQPTLQELRLKFHEQAALLSAVEPMENRPMLIQAILSCTRRQHVLPLGELQPALRDVAYPYEHAEGNVSLARFLLPHVIGPDQVAETQAAAEGALDAVLRPVHADHVGPVGVAEQIESDLGLPPLEPVAARQTDT